jgi:hypothetical protein
MLTTLMTWHNGSIQKEFWVHGQQGLDTAYGWCFGLMIELGICINNRRLVNIHDS